MSGPATLREYLRERRDEIDAALDEANVVRFVSVLREFGRQSQFIVITHNKKTVTGADAHANSARRIARIARHRRRIPRARS